MELKPCPFCGKPAKQVRTEHKSVKGDKIATWFVICTKCECGTFQFLSPEKAAKIWNRRANDV